MDANMDREARVKNTRWVFRTVAERNGGEISTPLTGISPLQITGFCVSINYDLAPNIVTSSRSRHNVGKVVC